jgi:hypothetical protein
MHQFQLDASIAVEKFKTQLCTASKFLNLCFQRGFSKNLDISRKRGMGFARSRFSLKISIVLKTPYKTHSFFFVGEVSVVLLPLSVALCHRKVVVDVT